jgi:GTP cyclohydrolase I
MILKNDATVVWAQGLLEAVVGLDTNVEHMRRTPERFVEMLVELTTPKSFTFTTFPATSRDMVVVKQIPIVSLCAHHVVPYRGVAYVGYIPEKLIVGLSKIPRLAQNCARKLSVQEELTTDIADQLQKRLETEDVAVVMECEHLCMTIRGVQAPGTTTYTAVMRGVFGLHERTAKDEFLRAIGR